MSTIAGETSASITRRSLSVPAEIYEKVDEIANNRHVSINRVIVDLLKDGIAAYDQRRQSFLQIADRFRQATDPDEIEKLRNQLAQMTFGG